MTKRTRMSIGRAAMPFRHAALAAMLLVLCAPSAVAEDFYAGKQITLIVGAGVGGGYDLQARTVARHLAKHISGNPTIIVQNMPSRIGATNHMFNTAPADGTTIALVQRNMLLAKLTYPESIRFDIQKFNWLGSLNSETAVTLAWHTAPHKTAKDLFDKELIVGGITSVDPETTPKLYNTLLGTKFKVVTGYNSTSQIALAIERGEVQGIGDWSWSSLKAVRPHWLAEKKVTLLMQGALKKEPELGNLPSALDFIKNAADRKILELHFTQKTAARPLIAPPGVPKERIAILRKAFQELSRDTEFQADVKKAKLEIAYVPGEEVDKVVSLIAATPADIADRYARAFAPEKK
ncbi:MAG TPA: tripartite tricarboxylate transporter substrate-binding protein [Rhodospirillales bacterium]